MKNKVPKLRFPEFSGEWEESKILHSKIKIIDGDRGSNYPNANEFSLKGYCLFLNAKNVTKSGFNFKEKSFISKERDCLLRKGKLQKNDLVLTTRGTVGNIANFNNKINIEHMRINSGMVILRNETSKLCSNYIFYYFLSAKMEKTIKNISFGSAQPQLTVKEINNFKITSPSLQEQEKIASFLSEVDTKIEKLEKKKELLSQYKKGMMQKLFSQKLRFKDENGNDYPEWEEKKLGEVLTIGNGKDYKHLNEGDIPVFGTGGYMTSVDKYLHDGETVFIGRKGTINKPFYYNGKFWTVDTLFYTHNFKNSFPKFIYVIFQNIDWLQYNEASGVPSLSKSTINNISINLPSLPEQEKIANFLSSIDRKIELVEEELEKNKEFKKGLLQQMFV